jgi:hypothetical protein
MGDALLGGRATAARAVWRRVLAGDADAAGLSWNLLLLESWMRRNDATLPDRDGALQAAGAE